MTTQAGETKSGFLWKQEHLSPLPIPTGQKPADLLNLIWRKNDVYLDIGTFAMEAGFLILYGGMFVSLAISIGCIWGFAGTPDAPWWVPLIMVVPLTLLMGLLWWLYIRDLRKPLRPPVRFNRQRREVCITEADGNCWVVPWERVHAIAPTVTNVGPYGAMQSGSLILWFPFKGQEDEPYTPDKKGWVMGLSPGGGTSSMAQWECIRSFMEVGPQAVPECNLDFSLAEYRKLGRAGVWWSMVVQFFQELFVKRKFGTAFNTLFFMVVMGSPWAMILKMEKLSHIPDLTAPEAVEWSKPLPPEQWTKRSPELERAIAERETELAEDQRAA